MLIQATNKLIAAARDTDATEEQVKQATQSFFAASDKSSKLQIEEAMRSIAEHFTLQNPARSAMLALMCGGLVEDGASPDVIAESLIGGLKPVLQSAADLAEACQKVMPEENDDQDPDEEFQKALDQVGPGMLKEKAAWDSLDHFWRPGIAVFSRSFAARQAAKTLKEPANRLSQYHAAGHWISLMLTVLNHEPYVAIEPDSSMGIQGHFSGIVDNFQLNTLLMDAFPRKGFFSGRRVSRNAAEVAKGNGPQQTNETLTSVWNLYNWQAIQSDLTLPPAANYDSSKNWIWNEGVPADIEVFEGHRAILLGPHSYPRSWQSQRMFEALPASLDVERKLTKDEVKAWLRRMADAKPTGM